MSSRDEEIGNALAIMRGDHSQQWVADEMRKRGWKWAQATVWNVERGERPLRLAEAQDLAGILGATVYGFMSSGPRAMLEARMKRMVDVRESLMAATRDYMAAQAELAGQADATELTDERLIEGVTDWIRSSPQSVVEEAEAAAEAEVIAELYEETRRRGFTSDGALRELAKDERLVHPETHEAEPLDRSGPFLRMLGEARGEHTEEG